jgi:hypothetical protein
MPHFSVKLTKVYTANVPRPRRRGDRVTREAFIAGLGAAALYTSCLVGVSLPATRAESNFHAPTCDEFKDRLSHTRKRTGIIVPDAEYTSYGSNDASSIAWAISNYLDFDANLECRDSVFLSMEIQPTGFTELKASIVQREFNLMEAAIAAWTGWAKTPVVRLVGGLAAEVADDMHKGTIYGEGTGSTSYSLPGGAVVHVASGGDGFHIVLNSADEEKRLQGRNTRQEPSMR